MAIIDALQVSSVVASVHVGENTVFGASKVLGLASSAREARLAVAISCRRDARQRFHTAATVHALNLAASANTFLICSNQKLEFLSLYSSIYLVLRKEEGQKARRLIQRLLC